MSLRACCALLLAFFATAAPAASCELATAPSTRWTIVHRNGVAWLDTPCEEPFLALGVNVVDAGRSGETLDRPHYDWRRFAASETEWSAAARRRLLDWGFNSAGAWSLAPQQLALPTAINLELGRYARLHWFDPFDPATEARVFGEARRLTAPYRGSPYRIGYFSDNEVGWWSGALFVFFSQKPAANFTKQRWVALLRRLYHDDWRRFVADFVPPAGVASWDGLLRAEQVTRLRPGGDGSRAVEAWTEAVAEHYYATIAAALKAADPDALYLGDRLPIYYDPAAVRAAARHVDALAVNYNVDSPEGWIASYFFDGLRTLSGGKPVFVSEWFYAAAENRSGNRNNGHLMTVATQRERALGAAAAARSFAAVPDLVGLDWFQFYDYPRGGRADGEDYDFGLVDIDDRPYADLVQQLSAANRAFAGLHAAAHPAARPGRHNFTVPMAAIDPAHHSLVDWPKPASLLPPLQATRGPAFGEAYLVWNEGGIALATIGQDYYDRELLAFGGAFPLSEAYRLELDVDAGAGPRRFTLYFVPPGRGPGKAPPMSVELCAGTAAEMRDGRCVAVPGSEALYFGADQPRIVAAMLLPWSALGLDGPPAARRMRLEVAASSWYRARSMSLSGLPPGEGAKDPRHWLEVRLAPPGITQ